MFALNVSSTPLVKSAAARRRSDDRLIIKVAKEIWVDSWMAPVWMFCATGWDCQTLCHS